MGASGRLRLQMAAASGRTPCPPGAAPLAHSGAAWLPLEPGVVLAGVAGRPALLLPPAGAAALVPAVASGGGVEALARDHHVGMAGVAVDRDPASLAQSAPARGQAARGHRARQQTRCVQDIA